MPPLDPPGGPAPQPEAQRSEPQVAGLQASGPQASGTGRPDVAARHLVLAELGRIPLDQPLGRVLQQVADLAVGMLEDVHALSVTLVEDGSARSAAFSDPVAALLDERQYEDGFGPCMDAARSGGVVRVRDTADERTYPGFAAVCRRHGIGSTTSVGVPWADRVVGALNLYVRDERPLGDDVVELAQLFAGYAGAALANAALYASATELAAQMQEAMTSRAVIEQAKGVLVAALGLDPDEAFAELARRSQRTNTKLRDVAADVVAQARGLRRPGARGA